MTLPAESLSVLVVDEEPDILTFFARILDSNNIRPLLARSPAEAISIAERGYVPIDLVLTDVTIRPRPNSTNGHAEKMGADPLTGRELTEAVRKIRPDVRALQMNAWIDSGVIRVSFVERQFETDSRSPDDRGLIETIRRAATGPMVRRAGGN